MNYPLTFSALACLAFAQAQNPDQPIINTPTSVVQCLPSLLTFNGGTPPYTISAIPAGQVGAAPLADLGSQSGTSLTWNVTLPAGTGITLQIRDSRGVINYSQAVTIQPNSDSSCLNSKGGNNNPSTPAASAAPPVATGSTSTPPATNATSGANSNPTSSATSNSTSNSTAPIPGRNSTASSPTNTSASVNQTKGASIFTPPNTSSISNSSSPSTNASNSAASGTLVHCKGLAAGLAAVGVALTIFA